MWMNTLDPLTLRMSAKGGVTPPNHNLGIQETHQTMWRNIKEIRSLGMRWKSFFKIGKKFIDGETKIIISLKETKIYIYRNSTKGTSNFRHTKCRTSSILRKKTWQRMFH